MSLSSLATCGAVRAMEDVGLDGAPWLGAAARVGAFATTSSDDEFGSGSNEFGSGSTSLVLAPTRLVLARRAARGAGTGTTSRRRPRASRRRCASTLRPRRSRRTNATGTAGNAGTKPKGRKPKEQNQKDEDEDESPRPTSPLFRSVSAPPIGDCRPATEAVVMARSRRGGLRPSRPAQSLFPSHESGPSLDRESRSRHF